MKKKNLLHTECLKSCGEFDVFFFSINHSILTNIIKFTYRYYQSIWCCCFIQYMWENMALNCRYGRLIKYIFQQGHILDMFLMFNKPEHCNWFFSVSPKHSEMNRYLKVFHAHVVKMALQGFWIVLWYNWSFCCLVNDCLVYHKEFRTMKKFKAFLDGACSQTIIYQSF